VAVLRYPVGGGFHWRNGKMEAMDAPVNFAAK